MTAMTISQVARAAGTGAETVRFYERTGLLPRPARTPSGSGSTRPIRYSACAALPLPSRSDSHCAKSMGCYLPCA